MHSWCNLISRDYFWIFISTPRALCTTNKLAHSEFYFLLKNETKSDFMSTHVLMWSDMVLRAIISVWILPKCLSCKSGALGPQGCNRWWKVLFVVGDIMVVIKYLPISELVKCKRLFAAATTPRTLICHPGPDCYIACHQIWGSRLN